MKLPTKVKVLGTDYTIVRRRNLKAEDGSVAFGLCDTHTCTIYLDAAMPPDRLRGVLTHELAHAVWYECGLNNLMKVAIPDDSQRDFVEEEVLDRLIPPLLAILDGKKGP